MEKEHNVSEADAATSYLVEDTIRTSPCAHSRAIDDVLTRSRTRTGKVRCLECGAVFDDPYQGSK